MISIYTSGHSISSHFGITRSWQYGSRVWNLCKNIMKAVSSGRSSPPGYQSRRSSQNTKHPGSTSGLRTVAPGNSTTVDSSEDPAALKAKINMLERDLERRQETYVSRERAHKTRIDELEEELSRQRQRKTGWMKTDAKMAKLKNMHTQIAGNVELVQDRTARILQEQERDLLRAFRARLFDVQTELEKEKSKKDDGAGAWIERSRQLEAEVEWAKEVADRLERVNQGLTSENTRLKAQFSSQEEDRNYLIKQLVTVKKDNARLRAEYASIELENHALQEQLKQAEDGAMKTPMLPRVQQVRGDQEDRYKEANNRLRKLLADERRSLQQVRHNYAQELKSRTEMEILLRACVEDVRKEIARRHIETAQLGSLMKGVEEGDIDRIYGNHASAIPVEAFDQEDRERVLELLLSQERVVTLVYSKTFPVHNGGGGKEGGGKSKSNATGPNALEDLLLNDDDAAEERPGTTGGLPSGLPGANPSTRPHTLPAPDDAGSNM